MTDLMSISLEAEVPEALYVGMKDFISGNKNWDQSKLISSAIANFLFKMVLMIGRLLRNI